MRRSSAPLARAAAFEHDDLTPWKLFRQFLRHLFGDAKEPLAPVHLFPDIFRFDARGDPQHHEIVDEIGAFLDDGLAIAVHGVDHDLHGLLGELLRHLAAARAQQPRRPRGGRIVVTAGIGRLIEPGNRITHGPSEYPDLVATGLLPAADATFTTLEAKNPLRSRLFALQGGSTYQSSTANSPAL